MKVLLITVRSDFGGGSMHVDQLIEQLPKNISVYLVCPDGEPFGDSWRKNERIKDILCIPYRRLSINSLFKLRYFVKKHNISIIHSHGRGAGFYSRLLKLLYPKCKVIHTYHGLNNNLSFLKKIIYYGIEYIFSYLTNLSINVSEGEKQIAKSNYILNEKKSVVVYNGTKDHGHIHQPIGDHTEIKVISITRFSYPKNMKSSLRIAKALRGYGNIKFVWVGDGEDRILLEEEAKRLNLNIDFVGFSTEPYKYLFQSNIFLSTSLHEGLPYALIEASSVGLPIVASNVIGNNEVVQNQYNGFLFNSEEEACRNILTFYEQRDLLQAMGANSRKFYEKNFTEEKMIKSLVNCYERI